MSPCPAPLALAALVDYWLGQLPAPEESAAEEHLMACPECSGRAERLFWLAGAVRDLVRRGGLQLVPTPGLLARLERDGLRVRHHHVRPGGRTACTAGPDDDLVTACLHGDFQAAPRVDLVVMDAAGAVQDRLEDVPVDREQGRVVLAESAADLRPRPAHVLVLRLYGRDEAGERPLGDYTLVHTPWPGAGAP